MIRTQKDRKLQTLIEVCTDFASLSHTTNVHRPAEQVFALEEDDDREEEMFAVVDRQQWNTQRAAEPPLSPELQQMFALARRMGYEMRPIACRSDAPRRTPGPQTSPGQGYRASAAVRWDIRRLGAPNRIHPYHFDQTVGVTGRIGHSDTTSDPHKETKYRPGPDPHWPVIDSDHASSSLVISDLHSEYSSASTYRGGSTTTSTTGHSVQLASQGADIQTSATAGDPADQFPIQDREESENTESSLVGRPQSKIHYAARIP